jgi:pimeloyl-ACP methyl ester carboxylesterase
MPFLSIRGAQIYYEDTGGPGEPVVFSHGLLWDSHLFEKQVEALRGRYRCISYDHRGQGLSREPGGRRPITLRTVYEDAVEFIQALGVAPCHFVGLSMGGFVGLRVAARNPEVLRSLVLLDTSAAPERKADRLRYRLLTTVTHWMGLRQVVDRVMGLYFGQTFLHDPSRASEREELRRQLASKPREVWRAMHGVINRRGIEDELPHIRTPTLILVGDEDVTTRPEKAESLHESIQGSRLVRLPHCGHMSNLEQPEAVTAAIEAFLDQVSEGELRAV